MFDPTQLSTGDIFYTQSDNQYHIYKLLVIEEAFDCYHVLNYEPSATAPDPVNVDALEVRTYHSPIDKNGFKNLVLLANKVVTADDLIGYHEYLRQTQEIEDYIPLATEYYQAGLDLTDEKKYDEAIDAYSKAIDLIPSFFEAIDNKAFCKMDVGRWEEAVADFKVSLEVNPGSLLAEFSIGECYFKMGDYQQAKKQFEIANAIDPREQAPIEFLKRVDALFSK